MSRLDPHGSLLEMAPPSNDRGTRGLHAAEAGLAAVCRAACQGHSRAD